MFHVLHRALIRFLHFECFYEINFVITTSEITKHRKDQTKICKLLFHFHIATCHCVCYVVCVNMVLSDVLSVLCYFFQNQTKLITRSVRFWKYKRIIASHNFPRSSLKKKKQILRTEKGTIDAIHEENNVFFFEKYPNTVFLIVIIVICFFNNSPFWFQD